jgi:hypothetical protein
MLTVPADRLPAAISDLDPGNRALLDLSLRRGVSDAEIGELLRKQPDDVARGRDAVLELVADALEVGGTDRRERVRAAIAALPDEAWQARPAPSPPAESAVATPEPREEGSEEQSDDEQPPAPAVERARARTARELDEEHHFVPEPKRSRRGALLALLGLLAVVVALAAVLLSGGDDDDEGPGAADDNGSQPAQNGGPKPQPGGQSQKLAAVGGGKGSGDVTVTDEGATITLRGLPDPEPGTYQVWLYDSIVQAQSLGTVAGASGRLDVKLPPDARTYRFLDVSHEPADANPNHSGDSVLRAPLGKLLSD